jgi:hypothetical protein
MAGPANTDAWRGWCKRVELDRDHGERQAERMIREMMGAVGIAEAQLLVARKGGGRKRLIARRVRQQTSVSLRWLAGRLKMGSECHVSRLASSLSDLPNHPGRRAVEKARQR